jgi:hypothetical protein
MRRKRNPDTDLGAAVMRSDALSVCSIIASSLDVRFPSCRGVLRKSLRDISVPLGIRVRVDSRAKVDVRVLDQMEMKFIYNSRRSSD